MTVEQAASHFFINFNHQFDWLKSATFDTKSNNILARVSKGKHSRVYIFLPRRWGGFNIQIVELDEID